MKNRIISLLTTIGMILSFATAIPATAYEYGEGTSWLIGAENPSDIVATFYPSDPKDGRSQGSLIIEGKGDMENFISNLQVPWSWQKEQITSVEISEGITSIGDFSLDCGYLLTNYYGEVSNLKSVKFPSTLTSIGDSAFDSCTALTTIDLPKGLQSIGGAAFDSCTGLTDVIIPDGVTIINSRAFGACTNLTNITIPDSVTYINGRTFEGCSDNLTIYCYEGGIVEEFAKRKGINYVTIGKSTRVIDKSELEKILAKAEEIDTSIYTAESVKNLENEIFHGDQTFVGVNSTQEEVDDAVQRIKDAIAGLVEKSDEPSTPSDPLNPSNPSESDPSDPSDSSDPTRPSKPTNPTGGNVKKTTSPAQKASQAKAAAEKAIKQAKITSLTAKAKGKKKIIVSWKKVAKAVGYEVEIAKNNKFKKNKLVFSTTTSKVKVKAKGSKIKSKKKYFVRVRAYATYKDAKGKTQKVYSKWIKKIRKVRVK